jgi:coenzyme PQQ precursor peptide PqqA
MRLQLKGVTVVWTKPEWEELELCAEITAYAYTA